MVISPAGTDVVTSPTENFETFSPMMRTGMTSEFSSFQFFSTPNVGFAEETVKL